MLTVVVEALRVLLVAHCMCVCLGERGSSWRKWGTEGRQEAKVGEIERQRHGRERDSKTDKLRYVMGLVALRSFCDLDRHRPQQPGELVSIHRNLCFHHPDKNWNRSVSSDLADCLVCLSPNCPGWVDVIRLCFHVFVIRYAWDG